MNSLCGAYVSDDDDLDDEYTPNVKTCSKCNAVHLLRQFRNKGDICTGCDGSAVQTMLPLSSSVSGVDSEEEEDPTGCVGDMSNVDMTIKPRAIMSKEKIQLPFTVSGICYTLKVILLHSSTLYSCIIRARDILSYLMNQQT